MKGVSFWRVLMGIHGLSLSLGWYPNMVKGTNLGEDKVANGLEFIGSIESHRLNENR